MTVKRVLKWTAAVIPLALLAILLVAYARSDNACSTPGAAVPRNPMKAVVYCDYGPPSVLRIEDVEKPVPGDSQLLVRVRVASVNALDWHYMRGTPYLGRFGMGLRRPKEIRLGVDYAGTVESVGKTVTEFKPGDEVFGGRTGAFAQYVTVRADRAVVTKPANVSFEQAAAVPVAALTALQALRDQAKVRPGEKVLINGASGGVGTFAVQLAKVLGADVTGVCSARNADMVRSLGADRIVDYAKEDFTKGAQRYDVIIDIVGNHSVSEVRRVLTPHGRYVMVGGPSGRWLDPLPRAFSLLVTSWFVDQDLRFFIASLNKKDLTFVRDLMQAGKVTPAIDRTYQLSEIRDAIGYQEAGHARAKVVVKVP
jgi:NADPH:quinone reductase-like Zn-dependent oxidoreductase